jgi:protein-tyrosine phosphatase
MAYRGQGLNDNSLTGDVPGENRLTVEDVKYLTGVLGIRTDLDLRDDGETAGMKESPLGAGVKFIQCSSQCYRGIFRDDGKKAMAANFRVFCRRENYPIYFHCIGGADRTGSLAYVMNGVLGVDRHELETDWESTFYPNIPDANPDPGFWCRESHFNDGFGKYGKDGDSWNRRIELYLLDCGVTKDEIEAFRSIMLE